MNKLIYKTWSFEDDQVKSGSCYLETSLPSSSLGINTLESVVKCDDPSIADFAQNDPVTYFYKGNQRGIYYIQSVDRIGPDRYTLTAVSALGLLAQKRHPGGIYTGQTVQEVVTDICGDIPVIIKSNLSNIALYGWLPYVAPPKSSAKDNLSQVLFAIGASVTNDLNGVLRIEPLWSGVSGVLDDDHVCQGGKVTTDPVVTAVSVTEHQYFQGGESKELFNGSTQDGDIITFDEPAYDLTAEGFDILESGANYAKVSSGSGKLTGRAYIHNTRQVTVEITPGPVENIKTPTGNPTLVSLVNSYAVAQRLAAYYKCRETIKAPALIGGNRPGAVVSMYHPYDKKMVSACLAVTDAHMSSVIKADLEALVGYEPPDIAQQEYYDYREVLTGSGEWYPPDGLDNLTVVLIGAGSGGQAGENGEQGESAGLIITNEEKSKGGSWSEIPGKGGAGGLKGQGGLGGKVLRTQYHISGENKIAYSCGVKGTCGVSNGAQGTAGTNTTFGGLSSDDGTQSANGYTDIITGEIFASTGQDGKDGAKGGDGGKVSSSNFENGYNGEVVSEFNGGLGSVGSYIKVDDSESSYNGGTLAVRGGNGGGGAAEGNNGNDATDDNGGTGADASAPPAPMNYGCGGHGGNGGGGGGGAKGMYFSCGSYKYVGTGSGLWWTYEGGASGKGSSGSDGADGCIILYYRIPKQVKSGAVMDKQGCFGIDRAGRLMVV